MSSRLVLPAVVLALGLAACTSSEQPAPAASESPAARTSPVAPSPTPTVAAPVLVLRPDGLDLVSTDGARLGRLDLGTATSTQVDRAIALALGGGTPTHEALPECGQGPRVQTGRSGFSVLYDGTTFVGWTDQGAKGRRWTTAAGLGVGSTLAQVKAAQPDTTTADDSLGPEFFSDTGISGMLDGLKASSTVTLVYAGETCFFR